MATFREKLFQEQQCGPRLVRLIGELIIFITLFTSFVIRYRRHFTSGKPKHQGTWKASPPTIKTPYETYLIIVFALVPFASTGAGLDLESSQNFASFLQTVDLSNIYLYFITIYMVLLHLLEEWTFRKHLLRPYRAKKAKLPALAVESKSSKNDLETMPLNPASAEDSEISESSGSSVPQPTERRSYWQSFKSLFKPKIPPATANNIHARYHMRAFVKCVTALSLFCWARTFFCQVMTDNNDFIDNPFDTPALVVGFALTAAYLTVTAVLLLIQGWRFARTEAAYLSYA